MEKTKKRYDLVDIAFAKELLEKGVCPENVEHDLLAFNGIGTKAVSVYDTISFGPNYYIIGAAKTIINDIKKWEVIYYKELDGSYNGLDAMLDANNFLLED